MSDQKQNPSMNCDQNLKRKNESTNRNQQQQGDAESDSVLANSEFLTRQEVLSRRVRQRKELEKYYKQYYWMLMEELRVKHREFYINFGKSPTAEENTGSHNVSSVNAFNTSGASGSGKNGAVNGNAGSRNVCNAGESSKLGGSGTRENGAVNVNLNDNARGHHVDNAGASSKVAINGGGGNGAVNVNRNGNAVVERVFANEDGQQKCAVKGCKKKAMAFTRFCHTHILQDPNQTLYKACSYVKKRLESGPVLCGLPATISQHPLCSTHRLEAEKARRQALNPKKGKNAAKKTTVCCSEIKKENPS